MNTGSSIQGVLNYNEHKVRAGAAEMLLATGFACDIDSLGFSEKLRRFELLIQRNEKIQTNTLHVSLNFPPDEILSAETMQHIAMDYMERIGFGEQPYLVYKHDDANHPHIHIVTTTIKENGKAISLHNIGKEVSEPARKVLEIEYGLIQAESRKRKEASLSEQELSPAVYGKGETKQKISNIVRTVTATYKYTSLEELNLILRQLNIVADRGPEDSQMFQNSGLVYSMLDRYGFKIGVSIKASSIYTYPTLNTLNTKFEQNRIKKLSALPFTKTKVESVLRKSNNPDEFTDGLRNMKIGLFAHRDQVGNINEINFIDNKSRAVFTTQELGMNIDTILTKLKLTQQHPSNRFKEAKIKNKPSEQSTDILSSPEPFKDFLSEAIKGLFTNEPAQVGSLPGQKKKKRKKKKH
jgi:hypothetical protein